MLNGFIEIRAFTEFHGTVENLGFSIPVRVTVDDNSEAPTNLTSTRCIMLSGDSYLSQAWNYKGLALSKLGEYDNALKAFDKSIELNPNFTEAWFNKGMLYLSRTQILNLIYQNQTFWVVPIFNQNNDENALVAFNRVITLNPKYAEAWHNKGIAHYFQGMYDDSLNDRDNALLSYKEALACETKVTELNRTFIPAWNQKGYLFVKLGEYQAAMDNFNKTLELDPVNLTALWGLGNTNYNNLKSYQSAGTYFKKLTSLAPTDKDAWKMLGISYYMQCQYDDAIASFDKILNLDPSNNDALSWRGEATMQKESDKKIVLIRGPAEGDPSSTSTRELCIFDFIFRGGIQANTLFYKIILALIFMPLPSRS